MTVAIEAATFEPFVLLRHIVSSFPRGNIGVNLCLLAVDALELDVAKSQSQHFDHMEGLPISLQDESSVWWDKAWESAVTVGVVAT